MWHDAPSECIIIQRSTLLCNHFSRTLFDIQGRDINTIQGSVINHQVFPLSSLSVLPLISAPPPTWSSQFKALPHLAHQFKGNCQITPKQTQTDSIKAEADAVTMCILFSADNLGKFWQNRMRKDFVHLGEAKINKNVKPVWYPTNIQDNVSDGDALKIVLGTFSQKGVWSGKYWSFVYCLPIFGELYIAAWGGIS